jgi:hypothetical protein
MSFSKEISPRKTIVRTLLGLLPIPLAAVFLSSCTQEGNVEQQALEATLPTSPQAIVTEMATPAPEVSEALNTLPEIGTADSFGPVEAPVPNPVATKSSRNDDLQEDQTTPVSDPPEDEDETTVSENSTEEPTATIEVPEPPATEISVPQVEAYSESVLSENIRGGRTETAYRARTEEGDYFISLVEDPNREGAVEFRIAFQPDGGNITEVIGTRKLYVVSPNDPTSYITKDEGDASIIGPTDAGFIQLMPDELQGQNIYLVFRGNPSDGWDEIDPSLPVIEQLLERDGITVIDISPAFE